jgi:inactivated superfamily I helicase
MFCVLTVEADKWAYFIKDNVRHEFKYRLNNVLSANRVLFKYIQENNLIDLLEDQGEWFSKALKIIMDTDDIEKKQELALLLQAHVEGKTEQCVDYLPKDKVIDFVTRFTTAGKDVIETAYEKYKEEEKI